MTNIKNPFAIREKTALSSIEVWVIWYFWHENWTIFTCDCCLRNSNSKTHLLIFFFVIEDMYVLLITIFSYSFTSFYSCLLFLWFTLYISSCKFNCHRQWLVYIQKNINTHGWAKRHFCINAKQNFQSFRFIAIMSQ